MISCNTWFGVFTRNRVYDGMTLEQDYDGSLIGDIKKRGYFWHSRELQRKQRKTIIGTSQLFCV